MADSNPEQNVDNDINFESLKALKEVFDVSSIDRRSCVAPLLARARGPERARPPPRTAAATRARPRAAQSADADGSGELDIEEFAAKLGPHLGANLTKQQVRVHSSTCCGSLTQGRGQPSSPWHELGHTSADVLGYACMLHGPTMRHGARAPPDRSCSCSSRSMRTPAAPSTGARGREPVGMPLASVAQARSCHG